MCVWSLCHSFVWFILHWKLSVYAVYTIQTCLSCFVFVKEVHCLCNWRIGAHAKYNYCMHISWLWCVPKIIPMSWLWCVPVPGLLARRLDGNLGEGFRMWVTRIKRVLWLKICRCVCLCVYSKDFTLCVSFGHVWGFMCEKCACVHSKTTNTWTQNMAAGERPVSVLWKEAWKHLARAVHDEDWRRNFLTLKLGIWPQEREQFYARKIRSIARAVHEESERKKKELEERMNSGKLPKQYVSVYVCVRVHMCMYMYVCM